MIALNWYLISHDLSVKHVINIYVNIFNAKLSCFLKLTPPAPIGSLWAWAWSPEETSPGPWYSAASATHPNLGWMLPDKASPDTLRFLTLFTFLNSNSVRNPTHTSHDINYQQHVATPVSSLLRFLLPWVTGKPLTCRFIAASSFNSLKKFTFPEQDPSVFTVFCYYSYYLCLL